MIDSSSGGGPSQKGEFRRDLLPTWEAYAQQGGIALLPGRGEQRRAVCGIHGGERDSLTLKLSGPWECKACGARGGDVLAYHRSLHGVDFVAAARDLGAWVEADGDGAPRRPVATALRAPVQPVDDYEDRERKRKRQQAAEIFRQTVAIEVDTPAGQYLAGTRHCAFPLPRGSELRWLPELRLHGFIGPALVGRMTLALDRRVSTGLHITWLRRTAEGWMRGERRYLGPKKGACVRLWPDDAVTTGLGVAEGIETALSLAHAHTPVWAALDAGNLAAFPVLPGIESLTIAADHDDAGVAAARACGERWADAGREVHIVTPDAHESDLNDLARAA